MREKILTGIREVNTWMFTGIAVLFAVALTTGLNSLFVWLDGGKFNPKIFAYATVDAVLIPLVIAPVMINTLKRVLNLEQANRLLRGQVEAHQRAQREAEERGANLQAISDLAIECAAASSDVDLHKLIAEKIQSITKALAVAISDYDPRERVLVTRHVKTSGQILSALNKILDKNIIGLRSPLSPEMLQQISKEFVAVTPDLHQISFGSIPKSVSTIVQDTFGVGSFTGLAFIYGGELWGTAVIVTKKEQPPIDRDLAKALANVAAMAMRRQKTETELQASEARYRALVEILPDAVTLLDLSGNIVYCNQQTAAIYGYDSVDQIVGSSALTYFAPEEHAGVLQKIQNALTIRQLSDTPFTLVRKDASRFLGEIRACLVPGLDSNPQGIIGITRDITERKKAEIEREALIRELEAKNTELERFTYTVSHDLKSPLITIRGFLGFIEQDAKSGNMERLKADVQRISDATDKMQNLLYGLLNLSRIGRMMNPPEVIPFSELVQDVLDNVQGQVESRRVKVEIQPDLPAVYGDRQRLVEALQNLLDNAVKFMGDQEDPQIGIGLFDKDIETGKLVFFVKDNGIGIESKYHERVFGLFNKLNPAVEGTGIGLALVKGIVEFHGGRIWVESEMGKGSVFYLSLPKPPESKPVGV